MGMYVYDEYSYDQILEPSLRGSDDDSGTLIYGKYSFDTQIATATPRQQPLIATPLIPNPIPQCPEATVITKGTPCAPLSPRSRRTSSPALARRRATKEDSLSGKCGSAALAPHHEIPHPCPYTPVSWCLFPPPTPTRPAHQTLVSSAFLRARGGARLRASRFVLCRRPALSGLCLLADVPFRLFMAWSSSLVYLWFEAKHYHSRQAMSSVFLLWPGAGRSKI